MERLLVELIERRAAMALAVFDSPPSDWSAFKQRLGAYVELAELIDIIRDSMKGKEDEE